MPLNHQIFKITCKFTLNGEIKYNFFIKCVNIQVTVTARLTKISLSQWKLENITVMELSAVTIRICNIH